MDENNFILLQEITAAFTRSSPDYFLSFFFNLGYSSSAELCPGCPKVEQLETEAAGKYS